MDAIKSFFENMLLEIPTIGIIDILDILIVAFIFYKLIALLRSTTAARIGKAIVVILALTGITELVHLNVLNYLLDMILQVGIVALVIIFQPELRRFMEKLGSRTVRELIRADKRDISESSVMIAQAVEACDQMSQKHIGALIVFERDIPLEEYFKSGTIVDAKPTSQIFRSLFFPNSALHDGAVIVRKGRVAAAGCVLPLTENTHISSDLGTRHRAGIGMSEVSDAVVVIVSEETGSISVAVGGMLKRHLAPQTLRRLLESELAVEQERDKVDLIRDRAAHLFKKIRGKLSGKGDRNDKKAQK